MIRPPLVLVIALVSAIGGTVLLANPISGINWFTSSISAPIDSQGLLPIANAIGKDLMLDVSPQLHPSLIVGESANAIKFQHWIDQEIHCEDCLRLEIPNSDNKVGVAFSNKVGYNFEGAKKIVFFTMVEEEGANVQFKAVGIDKDNGTSTNASSDDLFKNQEFALTSQNVTLNQTWSYFEMSLDEVQPKLHNVKYPFAFEVTQGNAGTLILYIKGIMYSSEPIQEQYLLPASSDNLTASALPITNTTTTALNVTLSDNATESVNAPATVEFNTIVSNGQEPYSYDWDFGDGAEDTDTDGNITHTFATPGLYNVTVDVVDSLNNTGSASTLVDVGGDQIVVDEGDGQPTNPLIVEIISKGTEGVAPATFEFEANITGGTEPYSIGWDFGDDSDDQESDDEEQTVSHTFEEAGTYNITLTATDSEDQNASDSIEINVEEPPPVEGTNTDDGSANATEANNNNSAGTSSNTENNGGANNSPPIANAGNDLVGKPNEQVILDGSESTDPDAGNILQSYQWEQESGPAADINDKGSPTPIVSLPNVNEDTTLVFSLTVNDGTVSSEEQDTISIFVDYIDELTNNVQQEILKPADIKTSQWILSEDCQDQGDVQCLSDGSDATFVAAATETIDAVNLYSFGEFSEEGAVVDPNSLVIERVVAEITAKKIGNTGYISFAIDDPREEEHYITPSISIASNSFQKYNHVWDVNPVTGEKWSHDSLISLIAGFKHDGGQSGVQISELQLTISYYLPPEASPPPAGIDAAEEANNGQDNQNEENGEGGTDAVENTDEQGEEQPGTETDDSSNSTSSDGNEEGSESEE